MLDAKVFKFVSYAYNGRLRRAEFVYAQDDVRFVDAVEFEFETDAKVNEAALDRVLRSLWLINGVSYYKSGMAPSIDAAAAHLTPSEADFLSTTYRLGLGQLCFENKISLDRVARFEAAADGVASPVPATGLQGSIVGFGGGKDSLVSTTLLDAAGEEFATFSATYLPDENPALSRLAAAVGHPHLVIRRRFDPQLLELNRQGAYNGHVPVTAIIMLIGLAAAVLTGRQQVIMSNEASAGEGNTLYEGVYINHQYAKTLEFEQALTEHVRSSISPDLAAFSLLRPLSELAIAQQFVRGPFEKFSGLYSSCNRNFKRDAQHFGWCGECPKCAFVYLILAPFAPKAQLDAELGGDLLARPELASTYRELLGLSGHKPFECVGEIAECQIALRRLQAGTEYPAAQQFEVPAGTTDIPAWGPHVLPARYERLLKEALR